MDVTDEDMMELAASQIKDKLQEINELKKTIYRLKKTLEVYGEVEYSPINDVEFVCLKGIEHLKDTVAVRPLDDKEAKTLDTLYKNLRMARGNIEQKDVSEKMEIEDLLKVIDGEQ